MAIGGVAFTLFDEPREAAMQGTETKLNPRPQADTIAGAAEPTVLLLLLPVQAARTQDSSSVLDTTCGVVTSKMFWKALHIVALLAAACL
jgi:hypothetical protein